MDTRSASPSKTRTKLEPIRPLLVKFLLSGFSLEHNFQATSKTSLQLSMEKDVNILLYAPIPGDDRQRLAVSIKLNVDGKLPDDEKIHLNIVASYIGRFYFPSKFSLKKTEKFLSKTENQYLAVSQVMPLAISHLKSQLDLAGLTSKSLPLGEP